jgi:hypothetical protein
MYYTTIQMKTTGGGPPFVALFLNFTEHMLALVWGDAILNLYFSPNPSFRQFKRILLIIE